MHPKDEPPAVAAACYVNGKPFGIVQIPADAVPYDVPAPKATRCRSRKRFIKLLMAAGIERNQAARAADCVKQANRDRDAPRYQKAYKTTYLQAIYGMKPITIERSFTLWTF